MKKTFNIKSIALFSLLTSVSIASVLPAQAQSSRNTIVSRPPIMSTSRNIGLRDQLVSNCNSIHDYDSRTACTLGIDLTLGAPDSSSMENYLALMAQCDLSYPESGGGIESARSTELRGKNRASCRSGIIWTRDALQALDTSGIQ